MLSKPLTLLFCSAPRSFYATAPVRGKKTCALIIGAPGSGKGTISNWIVRSGFWLFQLYIHLNVVIFNILINVNMNVFILLVFLITIFSLLMMYFHFSIKTISFPFFRPYIFIFVYSAKSVFSKFLQIKLDIHQLQFFSLKPFKLILKLLIVYT